MIDETLIVDPSHNSGPDAILKLLSDLGEIDPDGIIIKPDMRNMQPL